MMRIASLLVLCLLASAPAHAGPYSDDLAKCLVSSTSSEDRISLVRWIFSAFGAHPSVAPLSAATAEQNDEIDAAVAALFIRLLADACRDKTRDAIRYEGALAIQTSFQVLGQVAAQELGNHPAVNARMSGLGSRVDSGALQSIAEEAAAPAAAPAATQP